MLLAGECVLVAMLPLLSSAHGMTVCVSVGAVLLTAVVMILAVGPFLVVYNNSVALG